MCNQREIFLCSGILLIKDNNNNKARKLTYLWDGLGTAPTFRHSRGFALVCNIILGPTVIMRVTETKDNI